MKGILSFDTGKQVRIKSDGRIGTVSGLIPVKSGARGRPRTTVVVTLESGVEEYGIKDLKLV